MLTDQKISELPVASAIGNTDACLLVSNGADYRFTMSLLLQYVSSNINTGAAISFGNTLPQNNTGRNGDVFFNIATGTIAQKLSNIWAITYTPLAATSGSGNTIWYGLGLPLTSAGNEGDTYVDTSSGIFYKKSAVSWNQVFSMQSGPQGPQGPKGSTGDAGADGNTILSGATNPSNTTTGKDGDFYINTNTYHFFGPKTAGVWGTGITLVDPITLSFNKPADDFIYLQYDVNNGLSYVINGRYGANTTAMLWVENPKYPGDATRLIKCNVEPEYTWTNSERTTLQSISFDAAALTQSQFNNGLFQLKLYPND